MGVLGDFNAAIALGIGGKVLLFYHLFSWKSLLCYDWQPIFVF